MALSEVTRSPPFPLPPATTEAIEAIDTETEDGEGKAASPHPFQQDMHWVNYPSVTIVVHIQPAFNNLSGGQLDLEWVARNFAVS